MTSTVTSQWALIIMALIIGYLANQKGKNGVVFGSVAYLAGLAIVALVLFVDPLSNMWFFTLGLGGGTLYSTAAGLVGGAAYSMIRNIPDPGQ